MVKNDNEHRSEKARIQVLQRILEFVKTETASSVLSIELSGTDQEAQAEGWASMNDQYLLLKETIDALPIDVAVRIKLVQK